MALQLPPFREAPIVTKSPDRTAQGLPVKILSPATTTLLLGALNEAAARTEKKSPEEKVFSTFKETLEKATDNRTLKKEWSWSDYFAPVPENACIIL